MSWDPLDNGSAAGNRLQIFEDGRPTLHIEDLSRADFDFRAGEVEIEDHGEFPLASRNWNSLFLGILAFRSRAPSSEQLPKAPAEHKDNAREGRTHELNRKKP
jgi:hypothetical protein